MFLDLSIGFFFFFIDNSKGKNSHHQIESLFKAFARALRMACEIDPRAENTVASTKGSL